MTDAEDERPVRTARLSLRCFRVTDAALLKRAVDSSLEHLQPWLPWAVTEPSPLPAIEARLAGFRESFLAGRDWIYGIFDPAETEVLGGTGLHPRREPGTLEIGYWLRPDLTGRGLATEAVAALTAAGFARFGASRIEIRCDPRNTRSAEIPRRLGFLHVATMAGDALTPAGEARDTMVWVVEAERR